MIVHVFNSTIVSGPETLVIPALPFLGAAVSAVFLVESRSKAQSEKCVEYARSWGLPVHAVAVSGRIDITAVRALSDLLVNVRASVVHAHDVKASAYALLATRRIDDASRPALLSTHHGVHARSGRLVKLYEELYARLVLPRCDAALTVCSTDVPLLVDRGVSPDRMFVHLNGVDRPPIPWEARREARLSVRASWALPSGVGVSDPLIGVVARLAKEKNHPRLLAVAGQLEQLAPELPWKILCFGTGPEEQSLRRLTASLNLDHRVFWMGYRANLSAEFVGFDVLLSVSTAEGLPINLLEAAWASTPVVSSAVDGVQDLLPQADSRFRSFSLADSDGQIARSLLTLLNDELTAEAVGRALHERVVCDFSQRAWLDRLREIYSVVTLRRGRLTQGLS